MEARRWFGLAAALILGVLIGYGVARARFPESRYMVGHIPTDRLPYTLYRFDTWTGRTWWAKVSSVGDPKWSEILQP